MSELAEQLMVRFATEHFDLQVSKAFMSTLGVPYVDGWDFAGCPANEPILSITKEVGSAFVCVTLSQVTEPELLLHNLTQGTSDRWLSVRPTESVLAWLRAFGDERCFSFAGASYQLQVREAPKLVYTATVDGIEVPGCYIEEPGRPSTEALHDVWVQLVRGLGLAK